MTENGITVKPTFIATADEPLTKFKTGGRGQLDIISDNKDFQRSVLAAGEELLEEVASDGVRVVVIEPGNFRTEIARHSPPPRGKNSTQRYTAQWTKIDEWLTWHGSESPDPEKCVEAIVAAVTNRNTPFRVAIGEGVSESIRQRAKQIISQMDASDNFLNSL